MTHHLREVAADFAIPAQWIDAVPYGSGHINDTYLATYQDAKGPQHYILQRINHAVFDRPDELMENVVRVTNHQGAQLQARGFSEIERRVLTFLPTKSGQHYTQDSSGNYWRMSPFIARTKAYDRITSPALAREAARAFGFFQELAASLPSPRLHETIPHFHDTRKRYEALMQAAATDSHQRAAEVTSELDFVRARELDCSRIRSLMEQQLIPERVTHNDTKINNVLLDEVTGEGLCVIDLDTTMPGSALYDFGDLVRTVTPLIAEDAIDVSAMDVDMGLYRALIDGYLTSATFLHQTERDHLAFAGKLITLECGMRFLTDYLQGDTYFKCVRPGQNLERCRNQFSLVRALERHMHQAEDLVLAHQAPAEPPNAR